MKMYKSILIIFTLLSLSFRKDDKPKITRLFNYNLEVLNGSVQQLIETEHNHTAESDYPLAFVTNTDFDRRGDIVSQRKMEIWEKKWRRIKYVYQYDAKGSKTKAVVLFPKEWGSNSYSIWTYKYDKSGNIVESEIHWNRYKSRGKESYKYDSNRNLKESIPEQGKETYFLKMVYRYNEKGLLVKEIESPDQNGHGLDYLIEYKSFDSKGNWLKKIRIKQSYPIPNSKFRFIDTVTRKITYY